MKEKCPTIYPHSFFPRKRFPTKPLDPSPPPRGSSSLAISGGGRGLDESHSHQTGTKKTSLVFPQLFKYLHQFLFFFPLSQPCLCRVCFYTWPKKNVPKKFPISKGYDQFLFFSRPNLSRRKYPPPSSRWPPATFFFSPGPPISPFVNFRLAEGLSNILVEDLR